MGFSAPVADRPYFEFGSSSERSTKRVTSGASIELAWLSHAVFSAPVADRPYFEFGSSSERSTKRHMGCKYRACLVISCSIQTMLAIGEYRGILISLNAVVHF